MSININISMSIGDWLELEIDVSDKIDSKTKKIFRKHGLPICIYRKSHTLRAVLKKKKANTKCTIKTATSAMSCAITQTG